MTYDTKPDKQNQIKIEYNNLNNNNKNNNNNNVLEEALPPTTYDTKPDKQNQIKIEWTQGRTSNARTESEKAAVYDDTAKKDYVRTLAEYKEILIDYPYLQQDDEATIA